MNENLPPVEIRQSFRVSRRQRRGDRSVSQDACSNELAAIDIEVVAVSPLGESVIAPSETSRLEMVPSGPI